MLKRWLVEIWEWLKEVLGWGESTSSKIGKEGEEAVARCLKDLGSGTRVFHDIYIPREGGVTSQCDHVVVSRKGLFVIETKNYKGLILGNDSVNEYTQVLADKQYKFYSPVKQNEGHKKSLSHYLGVAESKMVSLIVFGEQANIKELTSKKADICQIHNLVSCIEKYKKNQLSEAECRRIGDKLSGLKKDKQVVKKHVAEVKKAAKVSEMKCPMCGRPLALRNGKYGEFIGCSGYPKCVYIKK